MFLKRMRVKKLNMNSKMNKINRIKRGQKSCAMTLLRTVIGED